MTDPATKSSEVRYSRARWWIVPLVVVTPLVFAWLARRAGGEARHFQAAGAWTAAVLSGTSGLVAIIGLQQVARARQEDRRFELERRAIEDDRRQVDLDRQRQQRIRSVAAVAHSWRYHGVDFSMELVVHNATNEPIYGVLVELLPWTWTRDTPALQRRWITAVPPHDVSGKLPVMAQVPVDGFDVYPALKIEFTDGAGIRWRRWPDGSLEEGVTAESSVAQPFALPTDPGTAWNSLLAKFPSASAARTAANSAVTELKERGVYASGESIRRAAEVAGDAGLRWDPDFSDWLPI